MSEASVRVAVRVRPLNAKELEDGDRCIVKMDGHGGTTLMHPTIFKELERGELTEDELDPWTRKFRFDNSFWSSANQESIHQELGSFILDNAFLGYNCSLFAYGQTGAGKSWTMMGSNQAGVRDNPAAEQGLIPRTC